MRIRRIDYTKRFLRKFEQLGSVRKNKVREREEIFKENCFDPRLKTHKLKGGLEGFCSFSITHSHRVLFVFEKNGIVSFIDIGDHSIYE